MFFEKVYTHVKGELIIQSIKYKSIYKTYYTHRKTNLVIVHLKYVYNDYRKLNLFHWYQN